MGRVVAIDFGFKRIGLAISDSQKKVALPYKTVEGGKSFEQSVKNVLSALSTYLEEIELAVIGLPLLLSFKKGEMALQAEAFKEQFEKMVSFPVILFDERLTSSQAEKSLKELSLSRKKRATKIDPIAATILLQTYLDSKSL